MRSARLRQFYACPAMAVVSALLVGWLGGCDPGGDGPGDDPGRREQALTGGLTFTGCTQDQEKKIRNAVAWLQGRVVTEAYGRCLMDALIIHHDWRMVEDIWAKSKTAYPVVFTCKTLSGAAGQTGVLAQSAGTEEMSLDQGYVNGNRIEEIGGTILHEIMHNHGFGHPYGVGHTVPDMVKPCALNDLPAGYGRSMLTGEVSLAHVGGSSTASEEEERCAQQHVVTGLSCGVNATTLTRFGLICTKPDGAWYTIQGSPHSGSTTSRRDCMSGEALVGIEGYAGSRVNGLWPLCASLASLKGDGAVTIYRRGALVGQSGDLTVQRICPNRRVVIGFRSSATVTTLDRVKLICGEATALDRRTIRVTDAVGGSGGHAAIRQCEGHQVMVGLFAHRDPSGLLSAVGGFCNPMSGGRLQQCEYNNDHDNRTEALGAVAGGVIFNPHAVCANGQVMVGIEGRATVSRVTSVAPRCVGYQQWLAGGAAAAPSTAVQVATGNPFVLDCRPPEVVIGLGGREGALVDQIALRCAEPIPSPLPTTLSACDDRLRACGGWRALTGIVASVDTEVRGLGAACGRSAGAEVYVNDGYSSPPFPAARVAPVYRAACSADQVMVGIEWATSSTAVVERVGPICQSLAAVRAGEPTPTAGQPNLGPYNAGQLVSHVECLRQQVVVGVDVNVAGGRITSFSPRCMLSPLLVGDDLPIMCYAVDPWVRRISLPVDHSSGLNVQLHLLNPAQQIDMTLRRPFGPVWSSTGPGGRTLIAPSPVGQDEYLLTLRTVVGVQPQFTLKIAGVLTAALDLDKTLQYAAGSPTIAPPRARRPARPLDHALAALARALRGLVGRGVDVARGLWCAGPTCGLGERSLATPASVVIAR
jgi:hypothetical protein